MLDLTTVNRRYFPVKLNGRVLEVEPPKLKTLNKLVGISKAASNGDIDAFTEMTPLIAQLLSKNKKNIRISPAAVEENLDSDSMVLLLSEFIAWINREKSDPN
jgi:hypothetical protein